MKKNILRLIAFVLVMTLALGCTAFAEDKKVKEVTLRIVTYRSQQTTPVMWYETDVYKYYLDRIEELYGYRITIDWAHYDTDRMNLMFVSGELPDIVYFATADHAQLVEESGYALDLAPLLDEYAPNVKRDVFAQRNALMQELAGGKDNALYFIPITSGLEMSGGGVDSVRGYSLRWDWYKEIGAPEITDVDSYIDALTKIVALHPTTEDGKTVYAYGYYDNFACFTHMSRTAFTNEALVNPWTFSGYLYSEGMDDNVLYNGYTNPERSSFWSEMEFANKLNRAGLLDPDSLTQNGTEWTNKVASGQYVGVNSTQQDLYNTYKKIDPNTTTGYMTVPSTGAMFFANKIHLAGYYPDQQVFVSKDSKNWEAALALLDYLHTDEAERTRYSGIEGVHWTYVDGVPTLTEEAIALKANGGDPLGTSGIQVSQPIRARQPAELHEDGYPLSLFETEPMRIASLNSIQKDYCEFYGVEYPSQARQKLLAEGKIIDHSSNYSQLVAVAREAMPTRIQRILTKCNDIMYRAMPELIAAQTDEEFAAIQQRVFKELEEVGEADAWAWCVEAQAAAHAIVDPIIKGE